jgi:60 kDa SS-A/Ro ribonucleoprotein
MLKDLLKAAAAQSSAIRPTDTKNAAGGRAYTNPAESALAQFAATGCFGATFHTSAADQVTKTQELLLQVDPIFAAQVAIYTRESGYMKDQPAFITASLAGRLALHQNDVNTLGAKLGELRQSKKITELTKKIAEAKRDGVDPARWEQELQQAEAARALARPQIEEVQRLLAQATLQAKTADHQKAVRDLTIAATATFGRCLDDGRQLKKFAEIIRSGVMGRKALASGFLRRMIQMWFDGHTDDQLFWSSVGNDPSLLDVIKLARVNPRTASRRAFFKWLANQEAGKKDHLGFAYDPNDLPQIVKDFEAWKLSRQGAPPRIPFQMLTALNLTTEHWGEIAKRASWKEARQSINTYARHGVFKLPGLTEAVSKKLTNKSLIEKAKVFPYQLMTTYKYIEQNGDVPREIKDAIQAALDASLANIPEIEGHVVVCPDNSGSMDSPITGNQDQNQAGATARTGRPHGRTTVVQCREVAALVAAAFLRRNKNCTVLPFDEKIHTVRLNPLDTLSTNAEKLSKLEKGGTNCALPLAHLNNTKTHADLVIYVSDYESWIDEKGTTTHAVAFQRHSWMQPQVGIQRGTGLMEEWTKFKANNPKAKLVCLDLTPKETKQVIEREDILAIGGFSDKVFDVIATFYKKGVSPDYWLSVIKSIPLTEEQETAMAAAGIGEDEITEE